MKTILLPVKDFKDAKHRLAPVLNLNERIGLARAMLSDVLRALSDAGMPERVVVFTAGSEAAKISRAMGFEVAVEKRVAGHSAAVNHMVAELLPRSSRLLAIAADLPLLTARDIDMVLERDDNALLLIPSLDGTGTNGIRFTPSMRITAEYGEGSLRRHLSNAAREGMRAEVLEVPGIGFDVDTPEDLRLFLSAEREDTATGRFLKTIL